MSPKTKRKREKGKNLNDSSIHNQIKTLIGLTIFTYKKDTGKHRFHYAEVPQNWFVMATMTFRITMQLI